MTLVCCKQYCFVAKSVLSQFTLFCRDLLAFCVEKNLTKNCACGEKKTNIRYGAYTLNNPCFDDSVTSKRMPQLNSQKKATNQPQKISAKEKLAQNLVWLLHNIFRVGVGYFFGWSGYIFGLISLQFQTFGQQTKGFQELFRQISSDCTV